MPDVGVLNLQIQDNSAQAAKGLDDLAAALVRVQNAVGSAVNLGNFTSKLAEFNAAVQKGIPEQTISSLERYAAALEKIKAAGGINIEGVRNAASSAGVQETESSISNSIEQANVQAEELQTTMAGVNEELSRTGTLTEEIQQAIGGVNTASIIDDKDAVQETNDALEKQVQIENDIAKARSRAIDQAAEQSAKVAEDAVNRSFSQMEQMARKSTGFIKQFNPATGQFEDTQYRSLREEIEDLDRSRQESEAQWRDRSLADAREMFANSSRAVQEAVANIHGMRVDELFPRAELEASAGAIGETADAVERLDNAVEPAEGAMRNFGSSVIDVARNALGNFRTAVQRLTAPISNLIKQFARIAKYRMLRAVIKHITDGFEEGVENYYRYSQAIGSSFAPAMDSAASSLLQMKNSIGAAVAPLIQSLIPYLQIVVNWFITLVNYANQFIALLRGQSTWSRATTQSATAFDKVKKSASGASAAVKDLLADWDELNIIQSESESGGGSGSGTNAMENALNMFEEVSTFSNKLKDIVDFIKDNFEEIKKIVGLIAAGILGWRISNAFTGVLSTLGSLVAAGAIIGITWKMTEIFDGKYVETGNPGWLIADALTNFVGATFAGLIVNRVLGGGTGFITAGIELTVSAGISYATALLTKDEDKANAIKTLSAIKLAIGAVALGLGFGVASGSGLLGFLSAGALAPTLFVLTAAISVVVKQVKDAKTVAAEAFSAAGEGGISVEELYKAINDEFKSASAGYNVVIDAFSNVPELKTDLADAFAQINGLGAVVKGDGKLTQEEADAFKAAWETVFSTFKDVTADSFDTVFAGLNASLQSENEEIREQAKQLRISLLMVKNNMSEMDAEIEASMSDLIDKVSKGTASGEELEKYQRYVEAMATSSNDSITSLQKVVDEGVKIDFGKPTEALQNAKDFLTQVKTGAEESVQEIEKATKAQEEAINELRKKNKSYFDADLITIDAYEANNNLFDSLIKNFADAAEEDKDKIAGTVQEAYNKVLSQALSGLDYFKDENGNVDATAAAIYLNDYVGELVAAILEGGGDVDDALKDLFNIGEASEGLATDAKKRLDNLTEFIRNYFSEKNPADMLGEGETLADLVLADMAESDWQSMAQEEFNNMIAALRDKFGGDAVRNALSELNIPLSDITVPLDVTVEESIEPEVETNADPIVTVFGIEVPTQNYYDLPDANMNVNLGVEEEDGEISIMDLLETPQLPDAHMKVIIDTEEEGDLHIEDLLEPGANTTGRKIITTANLIASAGGAANGFGRGRGNTSGEQEQISVTFDPSEQKGNIRDGVIGGTNDILTALRSILTVANALNNKQWTINVNPSSSWGGMNAKSAGMRERVSGDYIPGGMG